MTIEGTMTFDVRDEYNRKPIAEKIIQLLSSEVDVSPLIIDGGWGTGKTEFCKKLINLIDEKNKIEDDENDQIAKIGFFEKTDIRAVYVDAFKADHADEPLMTLLAAVLILLPESEKLSLKEKALPALRFGAKTVSKSAISWFLKQDAAGIANDFDSDLKKAGDEIVNNTVSSMLDEHVKADHSIETLKKALIELTEDSPITIFVDELDRCRPDFSISMLESIKHVFDVKGVQFVLVANMEQLKASVNHCYGVGENAQHYLDKFIGYKFKIPNVKNVNEHRPSHISLEHFSSLVRKHEYLVNSVLKPANKGTYRLIRELINFKNLSLREVETYIKYLRIYQTLTNGNGLNRSMFGNNLLRLLGIFLYCFESDVFLNGEINVSKILKYFGEEGIPNQVIEENNPTLLQTLLAILIIEDSKNPYSFYRGYKDQMDHWNTQIDYLFNNSFGYDGDGIETLITVGHVLSLK